MMEHKDSRIVCRACLADNCSAYFEINEISSQKKSFKDLIENLTNISVLEKEPHFVCISCAFQLEECFKFKQTLEETQMILTQVKTEEILDCNEPQLQENLVETDIIEEVQVEYEMLDEILEEKKSKIEIYDLSNCVVEVIDKYFECMYCSKQFTKERGLLEHLQRSHSEKKTFECKLCRRFFFSSQHLESHSCAAENKSKSVQMQCPECGRTGERKVIRNHIINVHRRKRDGPFQCDLCKIWLKSKECLTNHMKAKHLHRKFPCKFCPKSYSSRSGLDQHMQQYHIKEQTYVCQQCLYQTHCKTLFRKHELRHTNTAKFRCKICNCSFVSLENLRRHQFVHTEARPCVCNICERAFKNKEALKKHQAIHEEFRFNCPMCPRKYLTNQAMRNHCMKNHPDYELPSAGNSGRSMVQSN